MGTARDPAGLKNILLRTPSKTIGNRITEIVVVGVLKHPCGPGKKPYEGCGKGSGKGLLVVLRQSVRTTHYILGSWES